MTKTDVAVLGCRLISIWVCISASVRTVLTALHSADYLHSVFGNQPITWAYLGMVLPMLLQVVLAGVLWFAAPWLWGVASRSGPSDDSNEWSAPELLRTAFFFSGVRLLLLYLALADSFLGDLQPLPTRAGNRALLDLLSPYWNSLPIPLIERAVAWLPTILPLILSACLVRYAGTLSRLILARERNSA